MKVCLSCDTPTFHEIDPVQLKSSMVIQSLRARVTPPNPIPEGKHINRINPEGTHRSLIGRERHKMFCYR